MGGAESNGQSESSDAPRLGRGVLGFLRRNLCAIDLIFLGFLGLLIVLTLASAPTRNTGPLLAFLLPLAAGYIVLQRFGVAYDRAKREGRETARVMKVLAIVCFVSPIFLVPLTFFQLGKVMEDIGTVRQVDTDRDFDPTPGHYDPDNADDNGLKLGPHGGATARDHALKRIDKAVFGVYPPEWVRQYHTPALSGLMQWGYTFYYIAPALACVPLLIPKRRREKVGGGALPAAKPFTFDAFRTATAVLAGCILFTYIIYLLVPATGPRFEGGIEAWAPAPGSWLGAEGIYRAINTAETFRWNAFPSGHVAVGMVSLFMALRYRRKLGIAMIVPVILLCCATVYMGYHYAIDVLAGTGCAILSVLVLPRFARWWEGRSADTES
jgi:membrane-associated phospholipid phosphatase